MQYKYIILVLFLIYNFPPLSSQDNSNIKIKGQVFGYDQDKAEPLPSASGLLDYKELRHNALPACNTLRQTTSVWKPVQGWSISGQNRFRVTTDT